MNAYTWALKERDTAASSLFPLVLLVFFWGHFVVAGWQHEEAQRERQHNTQHPGRTDVHIDVMEGYRLSLPLRLRHVTCISAQLPLDTFNHRFACQTIH